MGTTSFLTTGELTKLGFKSIGRNCLISRNAQFYGVQNISIGDNVRIDDFCIVSGNVSIGSNIHISAFVALYGSKGIIIEDYTGISSRSTIYSAMDDFSGNYLVGSIHPAEKTNVCGGTVVVRKFAHIGANCLVFPDLTIGEGSVIGAMSMVRHSVDEWGIYAGIPIRKIKDRSDKLKQMEY